MPEAGVTSDKVERELQRILAEPAFARSPQVSKFLSYIVSATLRGDEAGIKAYSIAVDVFGRPANFDPQSDPIVRVQARRLRQMLEAIYASGPAPNGVRILLPTGRYVPVFEAADDLTSVAPDAAEPQADESPLPVDVEQEIVVAEPPRRHAVVGVRRPVLIVGALLLVASLALSAYLIVASSVRNERAGAHRDLQPPRIAISEFTSVPGREGQTADVSGLAIELMTDLALFSDLVPVYRDNDVTTVDADADFVFSGMVRPANDRALITTSLRRANSDVTIWSVTLTFPLIGLENRIDEISRDIASRLGNATGPLQRDNLQWLETHPDDDAGQSAYACRLLYALALQSGETADDDRASDCVTPFVANGDAAALAVSAGLLAEHVLNRGAPIPDPELLQLARNRAEEARKLAPADSFVWEQFARVLDMLDRPGEAEAAFRSALQLNPANLDAQAAYARMLSLDGISTLGEQMAQQAVEMATTPPAWYFAAPAVNALRRGDASATLSNAEKLVVSDPELGTVLAITAARNLGLEQIVDRYLAQLLDIDRFRRYGVIKVLASRLRDQSLQRILIAGLKDAGATEQILNGPA